MLVCSGSDGPEWCSNCLSVTHNAQGVLFEAKCFQRNHAHDDDAYFYSVMFAGSHWHRATKGRMCDYKTAICDAKPVMWTATLRV